MNQIVYGTRLDAAALIWARATAHRPDGAALPPAACLSAAGIAYDTAWPRTASTTSDAQCGAISQIASTTAISACTATMA